MGRRRQRRKGDEPGWEEGWDGVVVAMERGLEQGRRPWSGNHWVMQQKWRGGGGMRENGTDAHLL